LLRRKAMQSHNLGKKSAKRKRAFSKDVEVPRSDHREISKLFPGRGI
jgi:ribosomal protein L35